MELELEPEPALTVLVIEFTNSISYICKGIDQADLDETEAVQPVGRTHEFIAANRRCSWTWTWRRSHARS